MAKINNFKSPKFNKPLLRSIISLLLFSLGLFLLIAFTSFLINWEVDQSQLVLGDKLVETENAFGQVGNAIGDYFIYQGNGVASFFLPLFLLLLSYKVFFKSRKIKIFKILIHFLFLGLWLPVFYSLLFEEQSILGGRYGFEIHDYLKNLIGYLGIIALLVLTFILYIVTEWQITPDKVQRKLFSKKSLSEDEPLSEEDDEVVDELNLDSENEIEEEYITEEEDYDEPIAPIALDSNQNISSYKEDDEQEDQPQPYLIEEEIEEDSVIENNAVTKAQKTPSFVVEPPKEEPSAPVQVSLAPVVPPKKEVEPEPEIVEDIEEEEDELELIVEATTNEVEMKSTNSMVEKYGEFDPRLELSKYQFPVLELLKSYTASQNVTIDQRELESNKDKIVDTLSNYKINIDSIKATIGPTVTLYEIVPEAGVRISKIKNLEDDIALSLSALGIRIIAPIPGKGTIGIEVPNSHPTIVSMRSTIASQKFQNSDMELPIAFGKTISNETFVADLTKMPHLLMAGATGQGKSVGLNAIITSLLFKKHPAELKFVMVDPKKVELALYNKIERHFLAKLPGDADAIITDNSQVITTLNSLCMLMDERYELLKNAYVRNIKEYNVKFKNRKLNPENGHRYMPYIVLIVDEFADLIMTAGKEVETPIARLAQLARAVGIHLIIATQRPSVNVITGIIKANFPARVAYRVTSKIDSRTILDGSGADQLIGKGDMLFTTGGELIRIQCAFVDTPEVDELAEFIGNQKGYPEAFQLPEFVTEGEMYDDPLELDPNDRDALFYDAARVVVASQSGSASLLQRKLKIGFNRAGRIIDQLEANGIVGGFEGSKAREVLVNDDMALEQLLKND